MAAVAAAVGLAALEMVGAVAATPAEDEEVVGAGAATAAAAMKAAARGLGRWSRSRHQGSLLIAHCWECVPTTTICRCISRAPCCRMRSGTTNSASSTSSTSRAVAVVVVTAAVAAVAAAVVAVVAVVAVERWGGGARSQ